jgi:hypothetical protein
MIYAAGIRRLVISTRAKLLGIKLSIDQSICNQHATLSAIKSIKSMLSVCLDQSIQVELEILIVLLVDNSVSREFFLLPHQSCIPKSSIEETQAVYVCPYLARLSMRVKMLQPLNVTGYAP